MKISFVAPLIRSAIASLQTGLPAQIALFNAETANTVQLVQPVSYAFGAQHPLGVTGWPVIEVAVVQGRTGTWSIGRTEVDHDPTVTVCCWHEGAAGEIQTTYEMSLGLARCVIEVLSRPNAFGPGVEIPNAADGGGISWQTTGMPVDPTDDGRSFTRWRVPVLLTFAVQTVERFT